MPAKAGMFPWNRSYSQNGLDYDYLSGWHQPRKSGWQKRSADKDHVFTRTLYSPDGTKHRVKVYGTQDKETGIMKPTYHDNIGYHADNMSNLDEMLAAAEHAFSGKHKDKVEGIGHITLLEYAMENDHTRTGILRVSFLNGDVCLFFNVPPAVYGTLKHHAVHKSTAGSYRSHGEIRQRHLLGVEFWNLVRIRGHRYGAKFPFSYEHKAEGKIVRHGNRRIVTLTPDIAQAIMASDPKSDFHIRMARNLKPDTKVQVVLTDEEFAQYAEELRRISNEKSVNQGGYYTMTSSSVYDENDNKISVSAAVGQGSDYAAEYTAGKSIPEEERSIRSKLGEYLHNELKTKITNFMNSNIAQAAIKAYEADGMSEEQARSTFLREWYQNTDVPWAKGIDQRTGKPKVSLSPTETEALARVVLGKNMLRTWYQANMPAKEGTQYTRVVWTPQMLKDFANPTVPGNISLKDAPRYKAFIKAKDWEGALNFLQNHTFRYDYVKGNGEKVYRNIAYAGSDDILGLE